MQGLGYKDRELSGSKLASQRGRLDDLPRLAANLVQCNVDLIAVIGAVAYWAARKAAPDLPILFAIVLDSISAGMVDNAQRPGGKTTGCTNFDPGQLAEQIRILKMVVPGIRRLAVLGDAGVPDILPNLSR
ncbi:ABC transporter substrate binding protein, partial [Mesorhizobium sp.]|uniref:ABC transporter substrate binding protein n=1 Tax=Mesorhizobium sp. TaxID=1871066 RepID=UPI0012070112